MLGKTWKHAIAFLLLFVLVVPLFWLNALKTSDEASFASWQQDSESLVLAKIESDRVGREVDSYGLVFAGPETMGPYATVDASDITGAPDVSETYAPYTAQLGLMGYFYEMVHIAGCSSLNCLQWVSSGLFTAMLLSLTLLLGILTRRSFAVIFLLSVVASPWLTDAARNLYWSPWTWLLPVCAAALFTLARRKIWRVCALVFVFLAFCIKFASGYEFITSFALMAAVVPVLHWIFTKDWGRGTLIATARSALSLLGASILAFATILTIHASIRGSGDIGTGLLAIWKEDVQRRTYGSAADFDPAYAASLDTNALYVLQQYLFHWTTDVLKIGFGAPFEVSLGPGSLWVLFALCLGIIALRFRCSDRYWRRDLGLLLVTASIPISWFVLGKGHSFVHVHINFVLWYLFFVGALCFIIYDYVATRAVSGWLRITARYGSADAQLVSPSGPRKSTEAEPRPASPTGSPSRTTEGEAPETAVLNQSAL